MKYKVGDKIHIRVGSYWWQWSRDYRAFSATVVCVDNSQQICTVSPAHIASSEARLFYRLNHVSHIYTTYNARHKVPVCPGCGLKIPEQFKYDTLASIKKDSVMNKWIARLKCGDKVVVNDDLNIRNRRRPFRS